MKTVLSVQFYTSETKKLKSVFYKSINPFLSYEDIYKGKELKIKRKRWKGY